MARPPRIDFPDALLFLDVATEADPLGHVTTYDYDNLYREKKTIQHGAGGPGTGPETVYAYDKANTTTWGYDLLDRVSSETNALDDARSYQYDAVGNLTELTDRNGRVTEYEYDDLYRITEERWMDGQQAARTLSYGYDSLGRLESASDPSASYTYGYDLLDRTTSTTHDPAALTPNVVLTQGYDAAGNRDLLSATIGMTADFTNDYFYDELNRLERLEQHGETGGNAVAEKRVDFTYDPSSRFDTITRYADLAATQLVVRTDYPFDDAGRLTDLTHGKGAGILADYGFSYDAAGRLEEMVSSADGTSTYGYDVLDQLTSADHTSETDESYSYDDNGNRTNAGYNTTANNRVQSDGTYAYLYDAEGNRTRRFIDVNANGLLDTGDTDITEYAWDYRNRLVSVTERSTYGGPATQAVDYTYDLFNRLVGRSLDPDGDGGAPAEATNYIYDGDHIVLEFDGPAAADLSHRYLWGPSVDQILADEQVTSPFTPGDILWPLADHLGTVRDLATYDSQQDATTIANHRVYDSFGNLTSETNAAVDHIFGFTGRLFDEATGLQNNLNRWYDSAVGRWLSEDPIGFGAGDANLYRYVGNAPSDYVDSTGLKIRSGNGHYDVYTNGSRTLLGTIYYNPRGSAGHLAEARRLAREKDRRQEPFEDIRVPDEAHPAKEAIEETWTIREIRAGAAELQRNAWNALNPFSKGNIPHLVAVAFAGNLFELAPTAIGAAADQARSNLEHTAETSDNPVQSGAASAGSYFANAGENISQVALGFSGNVLVPVPGIKTGFAAAAGRGSGSSNTPSASTPRRVQTTTPWQRRVYQRSDVDWGFVRPNGVDLAGQTNRAAARQGYAPVRVNPQTGLVDDVVLHHVLDDPRGAVVETWRSTHARFHNTMSRGPNPWRQQNPDWARAWNNEQSAYWRWRTGAYNPPPQSTLRLPGDSQ